MNYQKTRKLTGKTLVTFVVLGMLAAGMAACGDKTPSEKAKATGEAVGDAMQATGEAVGDAAKATGEAVGDAMQATGEFLSLSKEEDVKAAQATLDRIEKEWQAFLLKAEPTTAEAKVDFQNTRDQMAETLADARARLAEAKDASADTWQKDVKPALDAALQKAQELYEDASARYGG
ncbi:MAG TPA: hypothetical protein ENO11_03355 [Desulfobacteraceae bacterium]|nr:hypothetical protein [Desulfobacteraceae bacterium]